MKGYELRHEERVMTIFSAPNYCYRCENKGAFLELDNDFNGRLVTFTQTSEKLPDDVKSRRVPKYFD